MAVHTSPNFKSNAERDEKQAEETQKPDEQEEGGAEQQEV